MEGWVDLGSAVKVHSPCSRLYIAAAVTINTTVSGVIRTWILSYRSQTREPLGYWDLQWSAKTQWRSHTSGVSGVRIPFIGLRVKPSGCANRKECYRLTHPLSKISGYATAKTRLNYRLVFWIEMQSGCARITGVVCKSGYANSLSRTQISKRAVFHRCRS